MLFGVDEEEDGLCDAEHEQKKGHKDSKLGSASVVFRVRAVVMVNRKVVDFGQLDDCARDVKPQEQEPVLVEHVESQEGLPVVPK